MNLTLRAAKTYATGILFFTRMIRSEIRELVEFE